MRKPEQYYFRYWVLFLMALLCLPALSQAEDWVYRIRPGETLSGISVRFLLPEITTAQLQAHNKIEEDREIPVGTEIRIPLEWLLQSPARAEIVFLRGEVDLYREGNQVPATLESKDALLLGDRVVTGPQAVVSIRFADGSRLLMGPQSEITLDTLSAFGETGMIDTRLRVQRGRVESRVRPLHGEGSRYEIHTPAAVTMVRGTGFRIGVEGDSGLTRNEVIEGDVAVAAGGETVSVTAGFGTLIEPGKPPASPRKLLASPDLSDLPAEVYAGSVNIQWSPLEEAKRYRLKLQLAGEDDVVLLDILTEDAASTLENLQPGDYQLLIRGIDELGLEGLTARHVLQVSLGPLLATPDLSALPAAVETGPVALQWTPLDGAERYRIKLHAVGDAESVLLDSKTADPAYTLDNLQPGEYQLSISGIDVYAREGTSGLHRLLVYPPRLETPDLSTLSAATEPGPIAFQWPPLLGAERYRFKLHTAGNADAILLDVMTEVPSYTLEDLQSGEYQLSISGIDVYEREGASGLHQLLVYPPRLAIPDLSALPAAVEPAPVTLQWPAQDGAESYRVKLHGVGDAESVLLDNKTADPAYTLENLQPGTYKLSVWAIDAYGRDGQADMHAFQVKPIPLIAPDLSALAEVVEEGAVTFQWPALDGAVSYRIQMRSAGDGAAVLDDFSTKGAALTLENLRPGNYQLSIKGMDAYGQEGLAGQYDLQVNRKPRAVPVLDKPLFGPGWMTFSWSQVEDAWGYRLLIARDASFQNPLFERIGMASRLRLPLYWQGRLFVRVDALFETDPPESHSGVYRIELPWR
ncbi:MAG: FecR domain-containing protein [Pseudomonadota bacterium]